MRARQTEEVALHTAEGLVRATGEEFARRSEQLVDELAAARTEAQSANREVVEERSDLSGALTRVEQQTELAGKFMGESASLVDKLCAAEEESAEVRTELGASRAEAKALRDGRAKD